MLYVIAIGYRMCPLEAPWSQRPIFLSGPRQIINPTEFIFYPFQTL